VSTPHHRCRPGERFLDRKNFAIFSWPVLCLRHREGTDHSQNTSSYCGYRSEAATPLVELMRVKMVPTSVLEGELEEPLKNIKAGPYHAILPSIKLKQNTLSTSLTIHYSHNWYMRYFISSAPSKTAFLHIKNVSLFQFICPKSYQMARIR